MAKDKKQAKKKLIEELIIPNDINVEIKNDEITLKKGQGSITRKINTKILLKQEPGKIIVTCKNSNKTEKKIFGSFIAHIKNAIAGLNEPFKYKLQSASVHFPITLTHDKNTSEIIIKNFLGEKKDRKIKVLDSVNVKISKDIIELDSCDIEKAGQTAANIEKGTKIRQRDRRVFQDGIFITEKPGRSFI